MDVIANRRGLLGFAGVGALLAVTPVPVVAAATKHHPAREEWDHTMRAYDAAKASCEAMQEAVVRNSNVTVAELQEEDRWLGLLVAAEHRLLKLPAPDADALLWKLEHLFQDDGSGYTTSWSIEIGRVAASDARRLAGAA